LVFDVNDFDETLQGPFEYDVKRLAASFAIAARNNEFAKRAAKQATKTSVTAYREAMTGFAAMNTLDVWYARLSEKDLLTAIDHATRALQQAGRKNVAKTAQKSALRTARKAHASDSLQALGKLTERSNGTYRIVSRPPVVVPLREL